MAFHNLTKAAVFAQLLVPQTITGSGSYVESSRVDVRGSEYTTVLVSVGAMAGTTTADVKLSQSNASSSGTTKDITGAALTSFTDAAGASKVYAFEVKNSLLDHANGFYWLSASYKASNTKTVAIDIVAIETSERVLPTTNGATETISLFTAN